ncbi:MAG TPA: hypothetical protein VKY59_19675 [Spirillospora sp.]|nr:hypothetical protein [Spirillospora sp.]
MMRRWIAVLILLGLAACGTPPEQPLPTQAQLPANDPTPTTESDAAPVPDQPTPEQAADSSTEISVSGAIEGTLSQALLSFELGSDYTLLFEQPDTETPLQLRLILAGDIEPGTYDIVHAEDFQRPEDARVAARFDLGFTASALSGTLTLESIGEHNYTGSIELTAESAAGSVRVTGRFENLDVVVLG